MESIAKVVAVIFILCSILFPLAWAGGYSDYKPGLPMITKTYDADKVTDPIMTPSTDEAIKEGPLKPKFYDDTCLNSEELVFRTVTNHFKKQPDIAAALVRLHLHDCFVRGCDASNLLDVNIEGGKTEKEAPANGITLRGFEVIDEAKMHIENLCPGVVSCADILAFAARDALNLSGLFRYQVPAGRRDGRVSRDVDCGGENIPGPADPLDHLIAIFNRKGLSVEDMVVLTGVHSIGVSHCFNFDYRTTAPGAKPVDFRVGQDIFSTCKAATYTMPFDPITQYQLDIDYYKILLENKGILESDQRMVEDLRTKDIVKSLAYDEQSWYGKLAKAMVRLGNIDVLTGTQGEIRKECRFVNPI